MNKRGFLLLALLYISIFYLFNSCGKDKPLAPGHDNPLDQANPKTGGNPFHLEATIDAAGIHLSWTDVGIPEVREYRVYRSTFETSGFGLRTTTQDMQWLDRLIGVGKTYYYKVAAVKSNGEESDWTNQVALTAHSLPEFIINGDSLYAPSRHVRLYVRVLGVDSLWIWNGTLDDSSAGMWLAKPSTYYAIVPWQLSTGAGEKRVWAKLLYKSGLGTAVSDSILPTPIDPLVVIENDNPVAAGRVVNVTLGAHGDPLRMRLAVEDSASLDGMDWIPFQTSKLCTLTTGLGTKTVWAQFKNDFEIESAKVSDTIEAQGVSGVSVIINDDSTCTRNHTVRLSLTATCADSMRISNQPDYNGVTWEELAPQILDWELTQGEGLKTVYVQFKNSFVPDAVEATDEIIIDRTAPSIPSNPKPSVGESDVPSSPTLSWSACKDSCTVTYDVRLDQVDGKTLVSQNQVDTYYVAVSANPANRYFWQVTAKDPAGNESSSEGWWFSTEAGWWDGFGSPTARLTGLVHSFTLDDNGDVIAGGAFLNAGGATANHIARWDGSAWHTLGSGLDHNVYALAIDGNGDVIAGGAFLAAGGAAANYIARWDGSSWQPLGSGMDGVVYALAIADNGDLIAGGEFTKAGGITVNHVARWDGSTWYTLYDGLNNTVRALAIASNGDVIAGGDFTRTILKEVDYIARWNGYVWDYIGDGFDQPVNALAIASNGDVIAGGAFTRSMGTSLERIARWDGSAWHTLGGGFNYNVYALAIDGNGDVIAAGAFTMADGAAANRIARWNGSAWQPLSSGLNNKCNALLVKNNENIFAGGYFYIAGGLSSPYIALWKVWTP